MASNSRNGEQSSSEGSGPEPGQSTGQSGFGQPPPGPIPEGPIYKEHPVDPEKLKEVEANGPYLPHTVSPEFLAKARNSHEPEVVDYETFQRTMQTQNARMPIGIDGPSVADLVLTQKNIDQTEKAETVKTMHGKILELNMKVKKLESGVIDGEPHGEFNLQAALAIQKSAVTELQKQLDEARGSIESHQASLDESRREYYGVLREKEALQLSFNRQREMNREVSKGTAPGQDMDRSELLEKIDDQKLAIDDYYARCQVFAQNVDELTNENNDLRRESTERQRKLSHKELELVEVKAETAKYKDEALKLEQRANANAKNLKRFKDQLGILELEKKEYDEQLDKSRTQASAANTTITTLKGQLKVVTESFVKYQSAQAELNDGRDFISQVKATSAELSDELDRRIEEQAEALEGEIADMDPHAKALKVTHIQEKQALEKRINELEMDKNKQLRYTTGIQNKLQRFNDEKAQLAADRKKFNEEKAAAGLSINRTDEAQAWKDKYEYLSKANKKLEKSVKGLEHVEKINSSLNREIKVLREASIDSNLTQDRKSLEEQRRLFEVQSAAEKQELTDQRKDLAREKASLSRFSGKKTLGSPFQSPPIPQKQYSPPASSMFETLVDNPDVPLEDDSLLGPNKWPVNGGIGLGISHATATLSDELLAATDATEPDGHPPDIKRQPTTPRPNLGQFQNRVIAFDGNPGPFFLTPLNKPSPVRSSTGEPQVIYVGGSGSGPPQPVSIYVNGSPPQIINPNSNAATPSPAAGTAVDRPPTSRPGTGLFGSRRRTRGETADGAPTTGGDIPLASIRRRPSASPPPTINPDGHEEVNLEVEEPLFAPSERRLAIGYAQRERKRTRNAQRTWFLTSLVIGGLALLSMLLTTGGAYAERRQWLSANEGTAGMYWGLGTGSADADLLKWVFGWMVSPEPYGGGGVFGMKG